MHSDKDNKFTDSPEYLERKEYFSRFLTIYGRNTVLEALSADGVEVAKLHISGNIRKGILREIADLAEKSGAEINHTTPEKVTRISKNGRQDQGVAADIRFAGYEKSSAFFGRTPQSFHLLALDGVTTPRNVGMIIRSCASGGFDGVIIPEHNCCKLNPLVIKASAGNIFKTGILKCGFLPEALEQAHACGAEVCALAGGGNQSLFEYDEPEQVVYVLGSEGEGVSAEALQQADRRLHIPMAEGVESLNVAMAATLVCYHSLLKIRG